MPELPKTILVIPCYNEAVRLKRAPFESFAREHPAVRLLFVDDGSTDQTRGSLESIARRCDGQVLALEDNQGKAEAVRQGVLRALEHRPQFVGYWDADLSTPLGALPNFEAVLERRREVLCVLGARVRMLGRDIQRSALRHYAGRVYANAASLALGLPAYDTRCGAKLLRAVEPVAEAFREPFVSRWAFDVELMARLAGPLRGRSPDERQAVFYELPLRRWHHVAGSKLGALEVPLAFFDLLRIRRRYLR